MKTRYGTNVHLLALSVAVTAVAGIGYNVGKHDTSCPAGYMQKEVRIYGQRLEAGFVPKDLPQVVVQNDPADTSDHRYVVALVCVRPLTNAERNP